MDLKNKVMKLYEDILEPVKARKIVVLLKYVIVDGETDIETIEREIEIREITIRKYLEDNNFMLNFLTQEELNFFREKMSKIFRKTKMESLIELILEKNETDINRIQRGVPITVDTLNLYFECPERLSKYLTEEQTKIFLMRLEQVLQQKTSKIKRLINAVLIDGEKNIDAIEKKVCIKIATIRKHLEDPKELRKYLTEDKLNLFLLKVKKMLEDKDKALYEEEVNIIKNIIDDILNTRYLFEDICSRHFLNKSRVNELFDNNEFMSKEFPAGTREIIKKKLKENDSLRRQTPRDCFVAEDRFFIMILKDNIHYLNQFDNKKISFVSYYLGTGANLDLVMEKFNVSLPEAFAILKNPKLGVLLKKWYHNILEHCLEIEKILYGNDLNAKREYAVEVINCLKQNNFDKQLTMAYYKIPEALFNRLLIEIIKLPYIAEGTKQEIKNILCIENEKKVK